LVHIRSNQTEGRVRVKEVRVRDVYERRRKLKP
jgi:hypothetical protein